MQKFKLIFSICILPENAYNQNFLHKLATLTSSLVVVAVFLTLLSFSVIIVFYITKLKVMGICMHQVK